MVSLLQDLRQASRGLLKAPALTVTAVVVLALGIGATTSILSLSYAVLLKPLPVASPDELYRLGREPRCCYSGGYSQENEFSLVSYELYEQFRDNVRGFANLAAFQAYAGVFGVRSPGTAEAADIRPGELVSGNYFSTFGVGAHAGRMLTPDDDRPDAPPVAVISYKLWRQAYASAVDVVGSVFDINGQPFTIVGVAPPEFFGDTLRSRPPDFFLPLNAEPLLIADSELHHPGTHWLNLIGRVEPDTPPAAIEAEMRVQLGRWLASHVDDMNADERAAVDRQTAYLSPGGAGIPSMRVEYERWLEILMLISGFVLLIVCANLANLLLARGLKRRPQTALCIALGARTWTVVRQALTESVLLALLGGAAGLVVAGVATRVIVYFAFSDSEALGAGGIAWPSAPLLPFALALSVLTGVAFGVGPAWFATRAQPIEALRGGGRLTTRASSVPRRALIVFQTALSLVLLSATGLLTAALMRLEHQDFGFEQDRRIVVNMEPRLAAYEPDRLPALYARIRDSMASIPGVESVALALYSPQSGDRWGAAVWMDGASAQAPGPGLALWNRVSAGYFDVIGNRIIRGRGFTDADTAESRRVAVVNEAFAAAYFPDQNPIGRRFGTAPDASGQFEVVGVAGDARYSTDDADGGAAPMYFLPEAQAPYAESRLGSLFMHDVILLTEPGVSLSLGQVRSAMAAADPGMPVLSMRTLNQQVASQFGRQRLLARLTSIFGVIALVLSAVGLYGVTANAVQSRNGEIAMRMALGADRSRVLTLMLRGALGLVAGGLAVGLPLTFAVGKILQSQLFGIAPLDPAVTGLAVLVLGATAFIAAVIPAYLATRVSPVDALRSE